MSVPGTIWCFESKADFKEDPMKEGDGVYFEKEKETFRVFYKRDGTKYYRRSVGCPKQLKVLVDNEPIRVFKPVYKDAGVVDEKKSRYAMVRGLSEERILKEALKHYYEEVHMHYDRGKDREYEGRYLARLKILRRLRKRLRNATRY